MRAAGNFTRGSAALILSHQLNKGKDVNVIEGGVERLFIECLDFCLIFNRIIDISINKIPALSAPTMPADIHRITFVLCFAVGVFDSLRIFFHKHMVKFLNIANDIQAVEITESAFEVQLKCFHR